MPASPAPQADTQTGSASSIVAGVPILSVAGVRYEYHTQPALDDVSFEVQAGELVALVGRNGAGKSNPPALHRRLGAPLALLTLGALALWLLQAPKPAAAAEGTALILALALLLALCQGAPLARIRLWRLRPPYPAVAGISFGAVIVAGNVLRTPLAAIVAALALAASLAALVARTGLAM